MRPRSPSRGRGASLTFTTCLGSGCGARTACSARRSRRRRRVGGWHVACIRARGSNKKALGPGCERTHVRRTDVGLHVMTVVRQQPLRDNPGGLREDGEVCRNASVFQIVEVV